MEIYYQEYINANYKAFDIVKWKGKLYIAKQDVPINTPINNTNFWSLLGNESGSPTPVDIKVDNETIDFNSSEELEVKDYGISKVKLDPLAKVVYTDDNQTLKSKVIDADNNTISNLSVANFDIDVIDTYDGGLTDNDFHLATSKLIKSLLSDVKIDNISIGKNADGELIVKDNGISFDKLNAGMIDTSETGISDSDDALASSKLIKSLTGKDDSIITGTGSVTHSSKMLPKINALDFFKCLKTCFKNKKVPQIIYNDIVWCATEYHTHDLEKIAGNNWTGNTTVEIPTVTRTYNINFTDYNNVAYDQLIFNSDGIYFRKADTSHQQVWAYNKISNAWINAYYRNLTFNDGIDIATANLINWVFENGNVWSRNAYIKFNMYGFIVATYQATSWTGDMTPGTFDLTIS